METWVDGRFIGGAVRPREGEAVPEHDLYEMPLKVGKKRMMGILRFAKLVSHSEIA